MLASLLATAFHQPTAAQEKSATPDSSTAEKETRYLAFQIFTYGPNPKLATMGEGPNPQPARFPDKAVLLAHIKDIKQRIGTVGDKQTRLAVALGQISFDHGDAETAKFIELGFELAFATDVAVGFHIDDSMFWAKRKDLWSDPQNVEALDWDGTPCTGRTQAVEIRRERTVEPFDDTRTGSLRSHGLFVGYSLISMPVIRAGSTSSPKPGESVPFFFLF